MTAKGTSDGPLRGATPTSSDGPPEMPPFVITAVDDAAGSGGGLVSGEEFEALLETLFARYDFDGSGDLNNAEELHQLTLNLVFKIGLDATPSPEEIQAKCDALDPPVSPENRWSREQYRWWFTMAFEVALHE